MRQDIEPIYDVIDWLRDDEDMQALLGNTDVFFPVQEDPKSGFPYVRYVATTSIDPDSFWMRIDTVSMALHFQDVTKSGQMMNILMDKLKAGDESALHLNRYLRSKRPGYVTPFTFKHTQWVEGGHTEPTDERGGAHARMLSFRYSYTVATGIGIDR